MLHGINITSVLKGIILEFQVERNFREITKHERICLL